MNNLPEVNAAWNAWELKLDLAIKNASMEVALRLKGDAMRTIKKSSPPGKAITGEPPTNRTGTLRNSVSGSNYRVGFGTYSAVVGADTVYARAVEVGTPYNPPSWKNGEHFPFIQPAVDNFIRTGILKRIIKKHLGAIK